ncbi:MAG: 1-acyl-sn-glycerol-3-phosphate acyltransferase [Clostridia bacterium]|nr:1-acyl-sn-glycerol-3-phosphate acyltransferase [Clostridia bacterium]
MKNAIRVVIKKIVRGAIYLWCKIYYKAEVRGLENIPKDGPLIFCGNHRTYLDPPLIVATAKRDMRFLAKEELAKNPFLNALKWVFEAILVKRDEKDVTAIKETLKTLKDGKCIALFPEGTRNGLEKGEKVKDGVAFFAVRTGAKIVPCGIKGGTKENRKVTITYGKPLDYSQYKGNKDKEVLEKITQEVMENIIELAKEQKRHD